MQGRIQFRPTGCWPVSVYGRRLLPTCYVRFLPAFFAFAFLGFLVMAAPALRTEPVPNFVFGVEARLLIAGNIDFSWTSSKPSDAVMLMT